ncbi:unnamed protein product, partial [Polarella glacialis]
ADKEIGAENAKREGESDVDIKIQLRKDVAQQEENAWLQTMMDSCTLDNREGDTGKGGTDVIPIEHPRQTERRAPLAASGGKATDVHDVAAQRLQQLQSGRLAPSSSPSKPKTQPTRPTPASASRWDGLAPTRRGSEKKQQSVQQQRPPKQHWDSEPPPPAPRSAPVAAPWAWVGGLHQAAPSASVAAPPVPVPESAGEVLLRQLKSSSAEPWAARSWRDEQSHQASECGQCRRGRPLKLFLDDTDGAWYCRMCWLEFYQVEPTSKR